jgi:hypothetical protein
MFGCGMFGVGERGGEEHAFQLANVKGTLHLGHRGTVGRIILKDIFRE